MGKEKRIIDKEIQEIQSQDQHFPPPCAMPDKMDPESRKVTRHASTEPARTSAASLK